MVSGPRPFHRFFCLLSLLGEPVCWVGREAQPLLGGLGEGAPLPAQGQRHPGSSRQSSRIQQQELRPAGEGVTSTLGVRRGDENDSGLSLTWALKNQSEQPLGLINQVGIPFSFLSGLSNLLESLGHAGRRRVVLGHTLNTL